MPFECACIASTIAVLATDLASVTPLACVCVVLGNVAWPLDSLDPLVLGIGFDLDFDLLPPVGGAIASPPVDDGSGVITDADAALCLLGLKMAGADCGAGEAPDARCACGGLPNIVCGGEPEVPASAFGGSCITPGTSHERSISSRSFALSFFENFALFLPLF